MRITAQVDPNLEGMKPAKDFLLNLDKEVNVPLPTGETTTGILRSVEATDDDRLFRIEIEIDDKYQLMFVSGPDYSVG